MSATCGYSENIYSLGVLLLVTHLRHSANATRTRPWRFGGASAVGVPLSVAQSSSARNPRQGRRESPTRSRADPIGSDRSMRFLRAAKIAVLCSATLPQRTGGLPEGFRCRVDRRDQDLGHPRDCSCRQAILPRCRTAALVR